MLARVLKDPSVSKESSPSVNGDDDRSTRSSKSRSKLSHVVSAQLPKAPPSTEAGSKLAQLLEQVKYNANSTNKIGGLGGILGNRPPVSKPYAREDINDNESITSFLKEEDTGSLIEKMEVLENRTINTEMNISETRGEIDILRNQVLSLRKIIDDAGIGNNGNVAGSVQVSTARRGSISGTSEGIIAIKQQLTAASEKVYAIYTSVVNLVGITFSLYVSMLLLPFRLVHKWFDYLLALVTVNSTSNGSSGARGKPTSSKSHTRRLSSTGAVVAPGRKKE